MCERCRVAFVLTQPVSPAGRQHTLAGGPVILRNVWPKTHANPWKHICSPQRHKKHPFRWDEITVTLCAVAKVSTWCLGFRPVTRKKRLRFKHERQLKRKEELKPRCSSLYLFTVCSTCFYSDLKAAACQLYLSTINQTSLPLSSSGRGYGSSHRCCAD